MKTLTRIFLVVVFGVFTSNITHAQSTKKEKKIAEIKTIMDENHYVFAATYVNPQRGAGRYPFARTRLVHRRTGRRQDARDENLVGSDAGIGAAVGEEARQRQILGRTSDGPGRREG